MKLEVDNDVICEVRRAFQSQRQYRECLSLTHTLNDAPDFVSMTNGAFLTVVVTLKSHPV